MNQLESKEELLNLLNPLSHAALRGCGLEAFPIVKQIDAWLQMQSENPQENEISLSLTAEVLKQIDALSHFALKSGGLEAFPLVKQLESWITEG